MKKDVIKVLLHNIYVFRKPFPHELPGGFENRTDEAEKGNRSKISRGGRNGKLWSFI